MKLMTLALCLATFGVGCGSKAEDKKPEAAPKKVDRIVELLEARELVAEKQPFKEALPKLEGKLGKPQLITKMEMLKVEMYVWARTEGKACAWVVVQRGCEEGTCGDNVGHASRVGPLEADSPRYQQCLSYVAGKDV